MYTAAQKFRTLFDLRSKRTYVFSRAHTNVSPKILSLRINQVLITI